MINNRQNGRRRGRGSNAPRPNGGNNGPDRGNRLDNRARGNAAQLHEKYKAMARDTHMQGDRVMTEYYLQFADHYFRILAESRARFEDNRPRQDGRDDNRYDPRTDGQDFGDEGQDDGDYGDDARRAYVAERRPDPAPPPQQQQQPVPPVYVESSRSNQFDTASSDEEEAQPVRRPRGRPRRDATPQNATTPAEQPALELPERATRDDASRRPRRAVQLDSDQSDGGERIEVDRLPPPVKPVVATGDAALDGEEAPRRRRGRPRRDPEALPVEV